MEGGCHRPSTHHSYAFVGGSTGRSALLNVVQFYRFERGRPACAPADRNRKTHRGLRATTFTIPLGRDGPIQGLEAPTHSSCFSARGGFLASVRTHTLSSHSGVRAVQRKTRTAEY